METAMDRYWINSPSTLQPLNKFHGVNVIAPREIKMEDTVTVYFLEGPVIGMVIPAMYLVRGWEA